MCKELAVSLFYTQPVLFGRTWHFSHLLSDNRLGYGQVCVCVKTKNLGLIKLVLRRSNKQSTMKRPPRQSPRHPPPQRQAFQPFLATSFARAEQSYVRKLFDERRKEDQLRALRELLRLAAEGPAEGPVVN